jgi:hypothetical protein
MKAWGFSPHSPYAFMVQCLSNGLTSSLALGTLVIEIRIRRVLGVSFNAVVGLLTELLGNNGTNNAQ